MRLVQIRNQAEPSELIPKYVYEEPSWLEMFTRWSARWHLGGSPAFRLGSASFGSWFIISCKFPAQYHLGPPAFMSWYWWIRYWEFFTDACASDSTCLLTFCASLPSDSPTIDWHLALAWQSDGGYLIPIPKEELVSSCLCSRRKGS
jgi:hypothetical protein